MNIFLGMYLIWWMLWLYAFIDVWFDKRSELKFFKTLWSDLTYFNPKLRISFQKPVFEVNDLKGIAIRVGLLAFMIGSFKLFIYIIK